MLESTAPVGAVRELVRVAGPEKLGSVAATV